MGHYCEAGLFWLVFMFMYVCVFVSCAGHDPVPGAEPEDPGGGTAPDQPDGAAAPGGRG